MAPRTTTPARPGSFTGPGGRPIGGTPPERFTPVAATVDPMADMVEPIAETVDLGETLPEHAVLVVAVEGEQTADMRIVDEGALSWREPPLTLTVNHCDDMVAGRIDAFGRVATLDGLTVENFAALVSDVGPIVVGYVTFDLGLDAGTGALLNPEACGREAARQVEGGFLLGVSMEVGNEELIWECVNVVVEDDGFEYCDEYLMHLASAQIGAVTVCPFQAIESARVIDTDGGADAETEGEMPVAAIAASVAFATEAGPTWWAGPNPFADHVPTPGALVARGSIMTVTGETIAIPDTAPAAWFADPGLAEPTPLTITADGRVFGHIAAWGTCHIGRTDVCITPPHSETDYAYFRTGEALTSDGSTVPVGVLTMGTGHADLDASPADTIAHYDHTGSQMAVLAAGEDAHGIWVAGHLHAADLTPQALSVLRAAAPSGDWRRIGGNLELVGLLAVNVPGFPVPRPRVLTAGGHQLALVAAPAPQALTAGGCGCDDATGAPTGQERRLRRLEAVVDALGLDGQAIDALAASLTP